jgi:hypothetical protein
VQGAGSNDIQYTNPEPRPLRILGAISPLNFAYVKLSNSNGRNYTNGYVPARALFNLQGTNQQYIPFASPIILGAGEQLKLELQNASNPPQPNGFYDIVFLCQEENIPYSEDYKQRHYQPALDRIKTHSSELYALPMEVNFTETANEEVPPKTPSADVPLLVLGIASELRLAEIELVQTWNNQVWSNNGIPIWSIAGDTKSSFLAGSFLPEPIFIPKRTNFATKVKNIGAEKAGIITFLCATP